MIKVSKAVWQGLEAVHESGAVNMLDFHGVMNQAIKLGFPDTAVWIHEHPDLYVRGAFARFEPFSS